MRIQIKGGLDGVKTNSLDLISDQRCLDRLQEGPVRVESSDGEILTRDPGSKSNQRIVSRILVSNKTRGVLMVE